MMLTKAYIATILLALSNVQIGNAYSTSEQSEIPEYVNWAHSFTYKPAVLVTPESYDEIASAIKDHEHFPSPVKPMGNVHSVTECVVNEVGTQVDMTVFKDMWFKDETRSHVVVQSGVTLLEMHKWLHEYGLESMISPEIGDATVGSVTTSLTKDAALNPDGTIAKGSFYEVIDGVMYLDHEGKYVSLNTWDHHEALQYFKCTDGLMGVVLETLVRVRPMTLVTYMTSAVSNDVALANYKQWISEGNVFMSISSDNTVVDRRVLAQPGRKHNNKLYNEIYQKGRYIGFQYALHPDIADDASRLYSKFDSHLGQYAALNQTIYRYEYTNHYPAASKGSFRRLDFTWYEYPEHRYEEIVTNYLVFLKDFKKRNHGWEPSAGAAVYFVERIPTKPFGWFSLQGEGFEEPGFSFTLDPANDNMHDRETWNRFLKELNVFAIENGARTALTQTRFITPEQYLASPGNWGIQEAPNQRFTSPWFARFRK